MLLEKALKPGFDLQDLLSRPSNSRTQPRKGPYFALDKLPSTLSCHESIQGINERHSSYGLKHMIEHSGAADYVTNGAFIAAAIHAGFTYKLTPHSPNVMFNISEKSLKAKMTQRSQIVL